MASSEAPHRGDIWLVALGAGRPGEPAKTRPAVVVSVDGLNTGGPTDLIVVVPVTSSLAPSALRIEIDASAGLDRPSRAVCRAIRAVGASRLMRRVGAISDADMDRLQAALSLILGLDREAPPG